MELPEQFALCSFQPPTNTGSGSKDGYFENAVDLSAGAAKSGLWGQPVSCGGGSGPANIAGVIQADSASITVGRADVVFNDANRMQAAGEITMDRGGSLGLINTGGEVFKKIHQGWIEGKPGEYFSLQSTTNPHLYLALDTNFTVKGLTQQAMGDISNSYWRYRFFTDIGGRDPKGSALIVLQYWGRRFGPDPSKAPYYFVIEKRVPSFKVGPCEDALTNGALGYRTIPQY